MSDISTLSIDTGSSASSDLILVTCALLKEEKDPEATESKSGSNFLLGGVLATTPKIASTC